MSGADPTVPVTGVGKTVCNAEREELGVVRALSSEEVVVSVGPGAGTRQRSTSGELGEAYRMWQSLECCETGDRVAAGSVSEL